MTGLRDKIEQDIVEALKQKNSAKVSALKMLKAAVEERSIQNKKEELKEEEVLEVVRKQLKQVKESIEAFEKGGRPDLVKKEEVALELLKAYLPPEATVEEITGCVKKVIEEFKPAGGKDFGRVMKEAMMLLKGKADGKLVSRIVKEELSKSEKGGG
ncbi:MAG: GatB/YqeY domain-containing protein [Candidatus Omnitrophica bacterium]|nr:GatB/YqeY domain-containing protein [Candidatus Omnitrophota bacterium]